MIFKGHHSPRMIFLLFFVTLACIFNQGFAYRGLFKSRLNRSVEGNKMYSVKENLKPSGLVGISDRQINDHWKLYEGYVKQVNNLPKDSRHRYGFEYNGVVLHEYYFENLTPNGTPFSAKSELKELIEKTWGSFNEWKDDFIKTGKTRGIGWAILYFDPVTKKLTNNFVREHGNGHIAGFKPLLVMDVWEHAYMVDHKAGGRADYIDAFMKNINWEVVEKRM